MFNGSISEYQRQIRLRRVRKLLSLFELRRKRAGSTNLPSHVVFGSVRPTPIWISQGRYFWGDSSNSGLRESAPTLGPRSRSQNGSDKVAATSGIDGL